MRRGCGRLQEYTDASRETFDDAFRKGEAAIDQLRDATSLSEEVYDLDVGDMLRRVIDGLKVAATIPLVGYKLFQASTGERRA